MRKVLRRAVTTGVATLFVFGAAAGPAAAHFCYKTDVNDRAAAGMAGSNNWVPFKELAAQELPGMCPAGVSHLAKAAGATPNTLIHSHATMAGGTLRKGPDSGNKAISHLDFEALVAAIPAAYAICS